MPDPRTDDIAREAARLIETGQADDVGQAIRCAAHALGYQGLTLPSHQRVRKHAQAMTMQAIGETAYLQQRRRMWELAEEMLTAIEHAVPDAEAMLIGRAAEGHIDAGVDIRIRVYTRQPMRAIVLALVDVGYEEPSFESVQTRYDRVDQARFADDEDFDIVLTRCVPVMNVPPYQDLVTGERMATRTLAELRQALAKDSA